jgi:hypothetical protein
MTNTTPAQTSAAARISTTRAIGAGIRKLDTTAAEIVATLPDTYDATVRGAVAQTVSIWINGDADAPAQKTGPKGDQTLTDYGRGFAALVSAVKRLLATPPSKTEAITVTYVDADGKSHTRTIATDYELFDGLRRLALNEA